MRMENAHFEQSGINGAEFVKLPVIGTNGGHVLRLLRPECPLWPDFPNGLGEIYFSEIEPGVVRAWKLHMRQTGNFAVPSGRLRMVLYDARADSPTLGALAALDLGLPDNYRLLRVPSGVWYGFKCLSETPALICNCPDIPHDPEDVKRLPQDDAEIPYKW